MAPNQTVISRDDEARDQGIRMTVNSPGWRRDAEAEFSAACSSKPRIDSPQGRV